MIERKQLVTNNLRKPLITGILLGIGSFVVGVAAIVLIVYLARKDSLPNPFSFSLLLYVLPLDALWGPVMIVASVMDYVRGKKK